MTPDLDSLATALYVKTDDLLKKSPQLAPYRPDIGITSQLSDAELVTLAVMQALPRPARARMSALDRRCSNRCGRSSSRSTRRSRDNSPSNDTEAARPAA